MPNMPALKSKASKAKRGGAWTIDQLLQLLSPENFRILYIGKLRDLFQKYASLYSMDVDDMQISQFHMFLQECELLTSKFTAVKANLMFYQDNTSHSIDLPIYADILSRIGVVKHKRATKLEGLEAILSDL